MIVTDLLLFFQNSAYYWGFAALVAYFVNHPLYTPPAYGNLQVYGGLALFFVSIWKHNKNMLF